MPTTKRRGSHERGYRGDTNEWLTPPEIIEALGPFDLDPCSPLSRPWDTARLHFNQEDDGLTLPWKGRVWLNPPYGPETGKWLQKLANHKKGTALIFARTETAMFFNFVWAKANSLLFLRGRLYFYHSNGRRGPYSAGAPSVLVAYGPKDTFHLRRSELSGKFLSLR